MRRIARTLVNAVSATSLVLALTTLLLWVASYGMTADLSLRTADRNSVRTFTASRGALLVAYVHNTPTDPDEWKWRLTDGLPPTHGLTFRLKRGTHDLHPIVTQMLRTADVQDGPPRPTSSWRGPGISVMSSSPFGPRRSGVLLLVLPLWLISAALAILPALRLHQHRRTGPARTCRCPACNYDLRATPTRCPECGQTISALTPSPTTPPS